MRANKKNIKTLIILNILAVAIASIFLFCFLNVAKAESIGGGAFEWSYKLSGNWSRLDYSGSDPAFSDAYDIRYDSANSADFEQYFSPYLKVSSLGSTSGAKFLDLSKIYKFNDKATFEFLVDLKEWNLRNKISEIRVFKDNIKIKTETEAKWHTDKRNIAIAVPKVSGTYRIEIDYIFDGGLSNNHWGDGYVSYSYKSDNFKLDLEAPSASIYTRSGMGLSDGGLTNEDIRIVAWDDNDFQIKVNGYNVENNTYKSLWNGANVIEIIDSAGNNKKITIYFDNLPPSGTLNGVENGGHTNSNVLFIWTESGATAKLKHNGGEREYVNNTIISNEGNYEIFLYDKAGNFTSYSFTIDKTAMNIDSAEIVGAYKENNILYINSDIRARSNESDVEKIKYRKKGENNYKTIGIANFVIENTIENQGVWELVFVDWCGNESRTILVVLQYENYFGNLDKIKNSMQLNYYYKVNLPAYIFGVSNIPNIANTYAFENYDSALEWCIKKEKDYRVQKQGNSYIYISATNESVAQTYTNIKELEMVVQKYAKRYVSGKIIYKNSKLDFGIIMDNNGNVNSEFFTRQTIQLPAFLSKYKDYALYQIKKDFIFKVDGKFLSDTKVNFKYIANDFSEISAQEEINIKYNYKLSDSLLLKQEQILQGYYLVTEKDLCGNEQSYLVYIKTAAPSLSANVTFGDGVKKEMIFDSDTVEKLSGRHYYINFEIKSLLDSLDNYLGIKVTGGKLQDFYLSTDKLPNLSYTTTGGGKYELIVYDRDKNQLKFEIIIAGKEPTWEYSSLKSSAKNLSIYFRLNDINNAIKELRIYKLKGNGEKIQLIEDSNGTPINFLILEYEFVDGGKYMAELVDLFGRTISFEPIFFQKGLPIGSLSIEDGASTNKTVTFQYDNGSELIVYVLNNSEKEVWTNFYKEYDNKNQRFTITFLNDELHNNNYLLYLYRTVDQELFIEYTFEIDTILAEFSISDLNDKEVIQNGATNTGIKINWNEDGVSIRYSKSGTVSTTYQRGDKIIGNGLYTFTIKDRVGNTTTFTILIDNIVDYEIIGNYKNIFGSFVTNEKIKIDVKEAYSVFSVNSKLGFQFGAGEPILFEDRYEITIIDKYDNVIHLIIIVDFTAPSLDIQGLQVGNFTKDYIQVVFEDGAKASLYNDSNKFIKNLANGEKIEAHGNYKVVVEDLAGNKSEKSFGIDKLVAYTSDVQNRQMSTSAVGFKVNEEMQEYKVYFNDTLIESRLTYGNIGKYTFNGKDLVGNTLIFEFYILPKVTQTQQLFLENIKVNSCFKDGQAYLLQGDKLTEAGDYVLKLYDNVLGYEYELTLRVDNVAPGCDVIINKNVAFLDNFTKPNCTIQLFKDGKEIEYTKDMQIKEVGKYKIIITDEVGNQSESKFEIKYHLSTWSILLIVLLIVIVIVLTIVIIKTRKVKSC